MRRLSWLLLVLCGCSHTDPSTHQTAGSRTIAPSPEVDVAPVVEQRLDTTVRLQGELSAFESVALHSRVEAYVEDVLVDRGSVVRKGQTLVRLSAPDLIARRAEAESQAQADAGTFESLKGAAATPGAVAPHDLEIAEEKMAASRSRVEALRAMEDYLVVRAPFAGVVSERNIHPGALVGPSGGDSAVPLLRIEQVNRLRLTVAVPEADVAGVAPGGTAEFTVGAWPGVRFSGAIARISQVIDPKTRTMPVEIDVSNSDDRLKPGMFVDVTWPWRHAAASLWVPVTALVETADRTCVDRVKDGVLQIVPVRRGATVGGRVEVFGPLDTSDVVLLHGSEDLRDGTHVTVRRKEPGP